MKTTQHLPKELSRQARRRLATNTAAWRRIRAAQLAREPLCRHCKQQGVLRSASEVDHIRGEDHGHGDDNLQSLCKPCHSRKTAHEAGTFGRDPSVIKHRGCDVDGNPLGGWKA